MKRLFATIFLIVYFVTSSGATIQLHFCMDKLMSWDVNGSAQSKCGTCGKEKKGHKGCCHDENRFVKIEKAHQASTLFYSLQKFSPEISLASFLSSALHQVVNPILSNPSSHAPPGAPKFPIYLSISVFRIWYLSGWGYRIYLHTTHSSPRSIFIIFWIDVVCLLLHPLVHSKTRNARIIYISWSCNMYSIC